MVNWSTHCAVSVKLQCSLLSRDCVQVSAWVALAAVSIGKTHPTPTTLSVDELYLILHDRLFGILRWSVSPFHAVSIVSTVSVKTPRETIHRRCHHHFLWQVVPRVDNSVAEEICRNEFCYFSLPVSNYDESLD